MEIKDILMLILFSAETLFIIGFGIVLICREIRKTRYENENRKLAIKEICESSKQVCDDNIRLIEKNVILELNVAKLQCELKELKENANNTKKVSNSNGNKRKPTVSNSKSNTTKDNKKVATKKSNSGRK